MKKFLHKLMFFLALAELINMLQQSYQYNLKIIGCVLIISCILSFTIKENLWIDDKKLILHETLFKFVSYIYTLFAFVAIVEFCFHPSVKKGINILVAIIVSLIFVRSTKKLKK